jgi:hypothetical protein
MQCWHRIKPNKSRENHRKEKPFSSESRQGLQIVDSISFIEASIDA